MSSKSAEKECGDDWLTHRRVLLAQYFKLSGMSLDSIMAVLHGLKTDAQQMEMGRGLLNLHDKRGKFPEPEEVMIALVSIRRTGKFSLTLSEEDTDKSATKKTTKQS